MGEPYFMKTHLGKMTEKHGSGTKRKTCGLLPRRYHQQIQESWSLLRGPRPATIRRRLDIQEGEQEAFVSACASADGIEVMRQIHCNYHVEHDIAPYPENADYWSQTGFLQTTRRHVEGRDVREGRWRPLDSFKPCALSCSCKTMCVCFGGVFSA